jgi:hypothetical protein
MNRLDQKTSCKLACRVGSNKINDRPVSLVALSLETPPRGLRASDIERASGLHRGIYGRVKWRAMHAVSLIHWIRVLRGSG